MVGDNKPVFFIIPRMQIERFQSVKIKISLSFFLGSFPLFRDPVFTLHKTFYMEILTVPILNVLFCRPIDM